MPYVALNPERWANMASQGNGECVALVQVATRAPPTLYWYRGLAVLAVRDLVKGSAIATFSGFKYANDPATSHAAIFVGFDAKGIRVIDQWNRYDPKTGKIIGKRSPQYRIIRSFNIGDKVYNQAEAFCVIL
jgi:hypothetical protein